MLEKIVRCSICKQTSCDGKEYIVPYYLTGSSSRQGTIIVCSSQVKKKGNVMTYRVVFGHGDEETFQAFPIPDAVII